MNLFRNLAAIAAAAMTALLFAAPASAQATRTWVSGVGDDANPCSRTAPCKTFAGAISKTAPAGEIICLDPGGFGAVTITKSITIDCSPAGGVGGVLVSGTNGIVIAGGTQVQLIALDIDGIGTGLNGVLVNATNVNVAIINCLIYEFNVVGATTGAAVQITGSGAVVTITNTTMRNNNAGVNLQPSSGTASLFLDHVLMDNNTGTVAGSLHGDLIVEPGGTAYVDGSTLVHASPLISNTGAIVSAGNNAMHGGNILGTAITTAPLQ